MPIDKSGRVYVVDLAAELEVTHYAVRTLERAGRVSLTRNRKGRLVAERVVAQTIRAHFAGRLSQEDAAGWLTLADVALLWRCPADRVWRVRRKLMDAGHTVRRRRVLGLSGQTYRYHRQDALRAAHSLGPTRLPSYRGRVTVPVLAQMAGVSSQTPHTWIAKCLDALLDTKGRQWIRPQQALDWLSARPHPGARTATAALAASLGVTVQQARPALQVRLLNSVRANPDAPLSWHQRQCMASRPGLHGAMRCLEADGLLTTTLTPYRGAATRLTLSLPEQGTV